MRSLDFESFQLFIVGLLSLIIVAIYWYMYKPSMVQTTIAFIIIFMGGLLLDSLLSYHGEKPSKVSQKLLGY